MRVLKVVFAGIAGWCIGSAIAGFINQDNVEMVYLSIGIFALGFWLRLSIGDKNKN
ncbi:hypothetical protein LCGC14_1705860 [marine sediment metagenome]|uniref:Uncharacterized protein n=1 Tax=marine sediment metagenome TaxID=412755 RepID=A0A0F9HH40_9ZZZZ